MIKKIYMLAVLTVLTVPGVNAQNNVIAILVDDLSVDVLDSLLSANLMPNLKSELVDQGVDFDNAFVTNPICCPSRATFLTGLYSHNHKVYSNVKGPVLPGITWPAWFGNETSPGREQSTVATWLQNAGYHTGFIGKYLNGYGTRGPEGVDPETYIPPGWTDWFGLIDPSTYRMYNFSANHNGVVVNFGTSAADYQTDVLAQRTADYLQARSPGLPFYLQINPLAPHVEAFYIPPPVPVPGSSNDYRNRFTVSVRPADRHAHLIDNDPGNGEVPGLPGKPSYNEANTTDKPFCIESPAPPIGTYEVDFEPTCVGNLLPLRAGIDDINVEAQYKSMQAAMLAVDDLIGVIFDSLEANGLLQNTAVIFTSDNGFFYGEHRLTGKDLPYEESIRVPLLVRAPGYAENATAAQVVLNNDMAPTIADLAGVLPPYDPDGTSLVPLLIDPASGAWHRKSFIVEHWFIPSVFPYEMATNYSIRSLGVGRDFLYTLTAAQLGNPTVTHREFYNLLTDPYQLDSLALPAPTNQVLDQFIGYFLGCQGAFCRQLESF